MGKEEGPTMELTVKTGFLTPLKTNDEEDDSVSSIPILQGVNILGRNDFSVYDKRVSRKHICLNVLTDGSAEVIVEGPNPVVIRSGVQTKKLHSQEKTMITRGDILELLPGSYFFKYVTLVHKEKSLASKGNASLSTEARNPGEEVIMSLKRKRQIIEDEAFARTLQDEETNSFSPSGLCRASQEGVQSIRHFNVPKNKLPSTFRLLQVQRLPTWANASSVSIEDVIQGSVLLAVLSNYMVDLDWLLSACPTLIKIPQVFVIHGEDGGRLDYLKKNKPPNWILHKPPLPISYGTHHSKAMILVYPLGVRIVIHTANYINVDWNNKSQGLWMQDFPLKDKKDLSQGSPFENDLIDYLSALKWPASSLEVPALGNAKVTPSFFKKFDYSSASVRLIGSVPGYHSGPNLKKWGHMKLRTVLQECLFEKEFQRSPVAYQFSSLGSLDEKWMAELAQSMSTGLSYDQTPLGLGKVQIIWPTVEDVRSSLEGYSAGSAIPSPQKNVEKDFLKKYWARWKANHTGRCRAMPHIKTYTRYNGQELAWFLLTSANLSKAAWGALQKNNSQLMIRSYELGVLFLPSLLQKPSFGFSCTDDGGSRSTQNRESAQNVEGRKTKLVTLCWQGNESESSSEIIPLPVPYKLPPEPYTTEDVPWSWDRQYRKQDVYGRVWPCHL